MQEMHIHVATNRGLFRYDAEGHRLETILSEDIRALTGLQRYVADAAVNLVYEADYRKMGKLKNEKIQ